MTDIIVALDVKNFESARDLVMRIGPEVNYYKIGSVLFSQCGKDLIRFCRDEGKSVFLDMKYHDIPNTVRQACMHACAMDIQMLTIHLSGGGKMIEQAAKGLKEGEKLYGSRPSLLGVSVLTSMSEEEMKNEIGIARSLGEQVQALARLGLDHGADGLVCSPNELELLTSILPESFLKVTPGIRMPEDSSGDQTRIATPALAKSLGATHCVMGRSIIADPKPREKVQRILANLQEY